MKKSKEIEMSRAVSTFSIFTSASTLLCCALPAALSVVGLGGAMVGLVTHFPQIVWVSQHKPIVFGVSGAMLFVGGLAQWKAQDAPCPVDPVLAQSCAKARKISLGIYLISVLMFLLGASFAFVPLLLA